MLTCFFLCQISTTKQQCVTYVTPFHITATQFPNQNPHELGIWTHREPIKLRGNSEFLFTFFLLCFFLAIVGFGFVGVFFCYWDYWWVFFTVEPLPSSWSRSLTIVGNLERTRWKGFVGDETKRFGFQQVYLE